MKREFSAGGIVINDKGEVLLINNSGMKDKLKYYWGFPKGHLNPGESSKDAALREIKEETNLDTEIIAKIGDSKYVFTVNDEKIFKVVTIFLMKHLNGEIKIQESELLGAAWFSPEEALKKLSFTNDKTLLKKALEL